MIYRDEDCLIIDKPAGLVVHPGAGNRTGTLLNALLNLDPALARVPRAGIVHRLDKDTSGLLVVARTLRAHGELVRQLEHREVRRTYEAVCQTMLTGGGEIDAAIGRHPTNRLRMAVVASGRPAVTRYRVMERFRAHTRVRVELETGRTHQIRVHFAHRRAPLVGDPLYGGRPRLPKAPDPRLRRTLQSFPRQALHARRLGFRHPTRGEDVAFESPLPDDLRDLLDALRQDAARGGGVARMTSPGHGAFIVPNWPAPARVRAASTLRGGGVSQGPYASLNLGTAVGDDAGVGNPQPPNPGGDAEPAGGTALAQAGPRYDGPRPGLIRYIDPIFRCARRTACRGRRRDLAPRAALRRAHRRLPARAAFAIPAGRASALPMPAGEDWLEE